MNSGVQIEKSNAFRANLRAQAKQAAELGDDLTASCLLEILVTQGDEEAQSIKSKFNYQIGIHRPETDVRDTGSQLKPKPRTPSIASRVTTQYITLMNTAFDAIEFGFCDIALGLTTRLLQLQSSLEQGVPPAGLNWIHSKALVGTGQIVAAVRAAIDELNVAPHQNAKNFVSEFVLSQKSFIDTASSEDQESLKRLLAFYYELGSKHSIPWANWNCSKCFIKLGAKSEAIKYLERELSIQPNNPEVQALLTQLQSEI